jgi:hypothetical protein
MALLAAECLQPSEPEPEPESEPEPEPEPVMEVVSVSELAESVDVEIADFDEADFAVVHDESLPPPAPPAPGADAFARFVSTLVEVALAAGASARVVEALPGMLGVDRLDVCALDEETLEALIAAELLTRSETGTVKRHDALVRNAQAWRANILGEETELTVTAMLDEWAAHIVAGLARAPQQREALRRDLRGRGIAAFGLLDVAA